MLLGDIIGFNLKLISSSSLNLYVKLFSDMQVCETNALILNDSLAPPPAPYRLLLHAVKLKRAKQVTLKFIFNNTASSLLSGKVIF